MKTLELVIYGRQPVFEALRSPLRVEKIWLAADSEGAVIHHIRTKAGQNSVPLVEIRKDDIQRFTGAVVHQGVAAQLLLPVLGDDDLAQQLKQPQEVERWLILDQIQDPQNLGAMLRVADIFGVSAVVMPIKGSAAPSATVAKTSAGALFHIPVFQINAFADGLELMHRSGVTLIATQAGAASNIYNYSFPKRSAIVIGNEGAGVRKNIQYKCQAVVSIPQYGKVNSLNASAATAVVLAEVIRQTRFTKER
jgi:23S rRNA (guanosine2251-2'-O)-methyltransferase